MAKSGKKNKLTDLNDHLFAQLERLGDEETKGEALQEEIDRSRAIGTVAKHIIDNARLVLEAQKALYDKCPDMPAMIGVEHKNGPEE